MVKAATGIDLVYEPSLQSSSATGPFLTAIIKLQNQEQFDLGLDKLRYFKYEWVYSRAHPYCYELQRGNLAKLKENTLFVKNLPVDFMSRDL